MASATSPMGDLRTMGLSIYYAVRDALHVDIVGGPLTTPDGGTTFQGIAPDWLSSFPVTVYINGIPTPSGTVYYPSGTVVFATPVSGTVTADYSYCYARVYDDYPDNELQKPNFFFPSVSVQYGPVVDEPLQLGPQPWYYDFLAFIDVWARDSAQRNDIANIIRHRFNGGVRWVDYNAGFPLTYSGTLNPQFDPQAHTVGWIDKLNWQMLPVRQETLGEVGRHHMEMHAELIASPY